MATQIPKIHIIAYIPVLPKVAYIWCSTSWPQIHSFGITSLQTIEGLSFDIIIVMILQLFKEHNNSG
jgi:hypothetical protein